VPTLGREANPRPRLAHSARKWLASPFVDFRDHDTRLAAYAIVRDERDGILLALRNEGPTPQGTLPGGGVEAAALPRVSLVDLAMALVVPRDLR